jgi:hypothetical protein
MARHDWRFWAECPDNVLHDHQVCMVLGPSSLIPITVGHSRIRFSRSLLRPKKHHPLKDCASLSTVSRIFCFRFFQHVDYCCNRRSDFVLPLVLPMLSATKFGPERIIPDISNQFRTYVGDYCSSASRRFTRSLEGAGQRYYVMFLDCYLRIIVAWIRHYILQRSGAFQLASCLPTGHSKRHRGILWVHQNLTEHCLCTRILTGFGDSLP